jgi:hypothetical protein
MSVWCLNLSLPLPFKSFAIDYYQSLYHLAVYCLGTDNVEKPAKRKRLVGDSLNRCTPPIPELPARKVRLSPLGTTATTGLLYQLQMTDDGDCGAIGGMKIGRENRSTRMKTCPRDTFSTTNPIWPDPGSNPGRRGGKPATNRLSYGAARAPKVRTMYW